MREFVTEDLISKLRVTKQISFTRRGLVTRSYTEVIPDEVFEQVLTNDNAIIDIPDYVNYNAELSTEDGAGVFVYDYERQFHDDKHEIICFNTSVETRFGYERECNNIGIVDYFYIKQTLEDVRLYHINVHVKDPYSEGTIANIYLDNDIIAEIPLGSEDTELGDPFTGVFDMEYPVGVIKKLDIVIVGNTNDNARSEFMFTFDSYPEKIVDAEEEVNEDA